VLINFDFNINKHRPSVHSLVAYTNFDSPTNRLTSSMTDRPLIGWSCIRRCLSATSFSLLRQVHTVGYYGRPIAH